MRTKNPSYVMKRPGDVEWTMVARVPIYEDGRMRMVRISQKVPHGWQGTKALASGWARDRVKELRSEADRAEALAYLENKKRRRTCASGEQVIAAYLESAKGTSFERSSRNNVGCLRAIWREGAGVEGEATMGMESLCSRKVLEGFVAKRQGLPRADWDTRRKGNVSINSMLRQARSILGRGSVGRRLGDLRLGDVTKFMEAPLLPVPTRFWTAIDPVVLVEMDKAAADHENGELRLGYLLARKLGLRLKEIMHARGSWLMRYACASGWGLQVCDREEEGFSQKGVRPRVLPLPEDLSKVLLGRRERDFFVMPGEVRTNRWNFLRYDLSEFVRQFLPDSGKTTHELRKQFGSEVMTAQGLDAAQAALGHMSRSTTELWYAAYVGTLRVTGHCVTADVPAGRADVPAGRADAAGAAVKEVEPQMAGMGA